MQIKTAVRIIPLLFGLLFIASTTLKTTVYMKIATISYCALLTGLLFRKTNFKIHSILIGTAIVTDLLLVMALEFQRNAIAKATGFTLPLLQQLHILHSSIACVLYFPVVWFGYRVFRDKLAGRMPGIVDIRWHFRLGIATIYFRSVGFFLMFSMIKND